MKTKSITFLLIFILSVLALPAYRLYDGVTFYKAKSLHGALNQAYNIDPILSVLGSLGNKLGISIDPSSVYQGKDGWLFLGKDFNQTLMKKINGEKSFEDQIQSVNKSINSWSEYLNSLDCKRFYIVIGPDKESIYPEYMPDWYEPNANQIPQKLLSLNPSVYVDTFSKIRSEKGNDSNPLYFKTDTHWNELGASLAFKTLEEKSKNNNDGLIWPSEKLEFDQYPRAPGDLSHFQRSGDFLNDVNVTIKNKSISNYDIIESSYSTGKVIYHGKNTPIDSPQENLLIKSPNALNNKKVVWLRDSFGTAMSRLMAVTFSETLQIHHARVTPEKIKEIILNYKPDYVIVTVVERDSMGKVFQYDVNKNSQ